MKQQKQEWEVILGRVKEQEAKEAVARMVQSARPSAIEAAARKAVITAHLSMLHTGDMPALQAMMEAWNALVRLVEAA